MKQKNRLKVMVPKVNRPNKRTLEVLVADDDPIFRELGYKALTSLGFTTRGAADGEQALKALAGSGIGLAIVDLQMPNIDGFALIRCIRASPRTQYVPIIVVTSRSDHDALDEAYEAGATSFLTKPVHWPTFASQVKYLMRQATLTHRQRTRSQRAESASRLKDAAIAQAVAISLQITQRIGRLTHSLADSRSTPGDDTQEGTYDANLEQIVDDAKALEAALLDAHNLSFRLALTTTSPQGMEPLQDLLAQAQTRVSEYACERSVELALRALPCNIRVSCYPGALVDALTQLLLNAVRFSAPKTAVVVEAEVHGDGLLTISISDDGLGMDPEFFAACLSPLSQEGKLPADIADTQCDGIAFVKAVAEAHGGSIEIHSMPRQGTTVMIALPAERVETGCEQTDLV